MKWCDDFELREPVWRNFVCAAVGREGKGLEVRRICPRWERVVSFVTKEVLGAVVPSGDQGLIGTESLVVIPGVGASC